jgi:hypothetical protein
MNKFAKVINPGIVDIGRSKGANLYCKIELNDGRLSISGVEGPLPSGNALGSCGQINMHQWNFKKLNKGWNSSLVNKFRKTWEEWHLNDMVAGSPKQQAAIKEWEAKGNKYEYTAICEMLKELGLHIDESYIHDGKPYQYGTAWLSKELPNEVISFLASLPKSVNQPAWV